MPVWPGGCPRCCCTALGSFYGGLSIIDCPREAEKTVAHAVKYSLCAWLLMASQTRMWGRQRRRSSFLRRGGQGLPRGGGRGPVRKPCRGESSPGVTASQRWRQNSTQFAHSSAPSLASPGQRPSVMTDHTDPDLWLLGSERPFSDPVCSLRGWWP